MLEQRRPSRTVPDSSPGGLGDIFAPAQRPDLVSVQHGVHGAMLPVADMTVGEIRDRFADHFDIDPRSQPQLDGRDADNQTVVRAGQELMFVRPSGEKGRGGRADGENVMMAGISDRITIEGKRVSTTSPEGVTVTMDLGQFVAAAFPRRMDSGGVVLPHGTALAYTEDRTIVWVHETPPRTYRFRWIAEDSPVPFGPGARYRSVRIALPYLVTMAVFEGTALSEANECFFRNGPIASEDDPLHFPALLNCSRFEPPDGRPLSWICTQKLVRSTIAGPDPNRLMRSGFRVLMHCLLETAFNDSSDHHEASSWYTESRGVDPRISTVDRWQEATERDPLFALEVPWLATGKTIHEVVERIFRNRPSGPRGVTSSADLVRVIFNHACRT